jgi:hypothetical protein
MLHTYRSTLICALLLCAAADLTAQGGRGRRGGPPPPPDAARPGEQVERNAFHWTGDMEPGQRFTIRSLNGGLHIEAAPNNTLDIVGTKFWRRGEPGTVKIDVRRTKNGVTLCAMWPGEGECDEDHYRYSSDRDNSTDVRVVFVVKLPPGVHVVAETLNGDVVVEKVSGDILTAMTLNGSVQIETTGSVGQVRTANGGVRVIMAKVPEKGASVSTTNGPVSIALPENIDATIDATTVTGSISSSFAIPISGSSFSPKRVRGTLGKGGPTIRLRAVNGNIRIEKR